MSIKELKQVLEAERNEKQNSVLQTIYDNASQLCKAKRIDTEADALHILRLAEKIYYDASVLNWTISHDSFQFDDGEIYSTYKSREYSITGNPKSGFTLMIPFLPKRFQTKKAISAKVIGSILRTEILQYFADNKIYMPVYESADVSFIAHIGNDLPSSQIPDGDNLDIKYVLDALNGTLLRNDSLLATSVCISGVEIEDQKNSFVEIKINPK